jgi:neurotrimin
MCQVNTDPMRSRKGYLQVVGKLPKTLCVYFFYYRSCYNLRLLAVPPVIVESITSNDMVVREGTNVTLQCKAKGFPEPYVMWRREDGDEMSINGENGASLTYVVLHKHYLTFYTFSLLLILIVNVVDGEVLSITKVSRLHMAAYLCVASNGVPPSISKRVQLKVQCKLIFVNKFFSLSHSPTLSHIFIQFHRCYRFQINLKVHMWDKMSFLSATLRHILPQSITGRLREET